MATSLRQLTEISEYISQEISTGGDPSLQNRTPMPFIFKMNGVLPSLVISKELKIFFFNFAPEGGDIFLAHHSFLNLINNSGHWTRQPPE